MSEIARLRQLDSRKPHLSCTLSGSYGLAITAFGATKLAKRFLDERSQETPYRSVLRAGVCIGMGNGDAKGFVLAWTIVVQRPELVGCSQLLCTLRCCLLDAMAHGAKSKSVPVV